MVQAAEDPKCRDDTFALLLEIVVEGRSKDPQYWNLKCRRKYGFTFCEKKVLIGRENRAFSAWRTSVSTGGNE